MMIMIVDSNERPTAGLNTSDTKCACGCSARIDELNNIINDLINRINDLEKDSRCGHYKTYTDYGYDGENEFAVEYCEDCGARVD